MAGEDVLERVRDHRVVERHDRTTGIAERDLDALIGEDIENELCAGCHGRVGHGRLPLSKQNPHTGPAGGLSRSLSSLRDSYLRRTSGWLRRLTTTRSSAFNIS